VVVEHVADLDIGAIGEGPVGDVGLPAFVGLLGGEPDEGALGSLVRLRRDESALGQDPPDRGHRWAGVVASLDMERDGRRACFVAGLVEFLADRHDLVLDLQRRAVRAARWPP
jgi:hypothetical protein